MNKEVRSMVQDIIEKEFLTDWEFVVERIAPQLEEEDFDVDEISMMISEEIIKRGYKLKSND